MIYNTRNRSNDITECQKKRSPILMLIFSIPSKITDNKGVYSWNKMWSLKSSAMLKCEGRTSLHALQYR